jgi:hypothetical protein
MSMTNERDTTPVTITLDRKRPYRVNDADRDAVWVGPGQVEVPKWVADEWSKPRAQTAPANPYVGQPDSATRTTQDAQEDGGDTKPPATVETVKESETETVETVEIVPADEAPTGTEPVKPKGKRK